MIQRVYHPWHKIEENQIDSYGDQEIRQGPQCQRREYNEQIDQECKDTKSPDNLDRDPQIVKYLQNLRTIRLFSIFEVATDRNF